VGYNKLMSRQKHYYVLQMYETIHVKYNKHKELYWNREQQFEKFVPLIFLSASGDRVVVNIFLLFWNA
jgi:hypothetical protein